MFQAKKVVTALCNIMLRKPGRKRSQKSPVAKARQQGCKGNVQLVQAIPYQKNIVIINQNKVFVNVFLLLVMRKSDVHFLKQHHSVCVALFFSLAGGGDIYVLYFLKRTYEPPDYSVVRGRKNAR